MRSFWTARNIAIICVVVGLGLTIYLGVWAAGDHPPNGAQSGILVLLAGLFQIGGPAYLFKSRRLNATVARTTANKLGAMTVRADTARKAAEIAFDSATTEEMRDTVGQVSAVLSFLQEDLSLLAIQWIEISRDVLDLTQGGADESAED